MNKELRIRKGEDSFTFNVGAIVETFQVAGIPTDKAISLARQLEESLRARNTVFTLEQLNSEMETLIAEQLGEYAAHRFRQFIPPFVPLRIVSAAPSGEIRRERFSRRQLTKSLEKLSLTFKEANALAQQVEQRMRSHGREEFGQEELRREVIAVLESRYGRELALRYQASTGRVQEIRVIGRGGGVLPFSRGILAQSVMAIGLEPELSYGIAKRVEQALYERYVDRITPTELREIVVDLLRKEAGEEFARRYLLMLRARKPEQPLIVLIGGAPGVGKSAIAAELSYRLGIPRLVSSDSVRQALRSLISPQLSPVLHASTYNAWKAELLPFERENSRPNRKQVLRAYLAQVHQLSPALDGIIDRSITEATSVVIEGAHVVPGEIAQRSFPGATVMHLALYVKDADDHSRHFEIRERQTGSKRAEKSYVTHFKEVRIIHDYLVEQAGLHNVHAIDVTDFDRGLERCIEVVLEVMTRDQLDEGGILSEMFSQS